jgi:glycosyltransferase involved in cell wall biosynthesis
METKLHITPDWPAHGSLAWQLLHHDRPFNPKEHVKEHGPMRVLHLLSQQPGKTGSGVYLQALVHQGAEDGLEQNIIVGIPSEFSELSLGTLDSSCIACVRFCDADLPYPVAGMSDVMPYQSTKFSDFTNEMLDAYLYAFASILKMNVQEFRPHLIHTHHLWLATALTRLLFPDIPLVTTCHGTELRQLELVPSLRAFVIPACSCVDRVMALHENHMIRIQELYGIEMSRIRLIGAGFRNDIFCLPEAKSCSRSQKDTLTVVYAGKLSFAKGVPWLIESAEHLEHPEGKNIRLRIVGSGAGDEARLIRDRALRLHDIVEFLGPKPQEDLAVILQDADVFVLPSLYEGLPLVVLEAIACSCRVVVTNLPGIRHWLPERLIEDGIVEVVPMPVLIGPDVPDPAGLPLFVHNLVSAINRQLSRSTVQEPDWENEVMPCIESMNWQGIYRKIKSVYEEVLLP